MFPYITQVEGFKKTSVKVEVSTQGFYPSNSMKVLVSKLLLYIRIKVKEM